MEFHTAQGTSGVMKSNAFVLAITKRAMSMAEEAVFDRLAPSWLNVIEMTGDTCHSDVSGKIELVKPITHPQMI